MRLGQLVSILMGLMGVVSIGLYVDPGLLGLADQTKHYRGEFVWLLVGLGFVAVALGFIALFRNRPKRLLWILHNETPTQMYVTLALNRGMDSTTYSAILRHEPGAKREWTVQLYRPSWPAAALDVLQHQPNLARVYFDPKCGYPAVVETEYGLLWAMAGRSASRG
jgi:hypothetical protein